MTEVIRMPARGRYHAWEVGHLAGVSGRTVGQWARRRYIRSSVDDTAPRIYSYPDAAEAMVVHELLDRRVAHRDIKRAIGLLETNYGDWPLTEAPLATQRGKERSRVVFVDDEAAYDVGRVGWQQIISPQNLEAVRDRLKRGGWAVRNIPDLEFIEVNPERLSGRPTIKGRRIAAQDVAEMADAPHGVETLMDDYELDKREIADARRWWKEVRRLESLAA